MSKQRLAIYRTRYACVRQRDGQLQVWAGLAQNYKFVPVRELKETAIKTYRSQPMARSGCSYWYKDSDPTFRIIEVQESIQEVTNKV